jgi:hypothetical protein
VDLDVVDHPAARELHLHPPESEPSPTDTLRPVLLVDEIAGILGE